MSATFTLPMSAVDQFGHGHNRSQSQTKHHARHSRSSNRLAPPFPLARIPSESISHLSVESQNALLDSSGRYQSHTHNHSAHRSNNVRAPRFDPNGLVAAKRRASDATTMASSSTTTGCGHEHRDISKPTAFLLKTTENYSLLHGILADNDSRRIFYFMILNLAFMVVQSTYGFLTGSLGLISDSVHMFFDCVALLVGVCAAVMSKWPPSVKFPYGYGKIDTLAGLGNGVFLMLISVEIIFEAFERLFNGADVSRTGELLIVSIAGLAVNLVGIFAFHGHHGHDHGHDHGHGHKHEHEHDHDHDHDHAHHEHHEHSHSHSDSHSHGHDRRAHEHKDSDISVTATISASPAKPKSVGVLGHSHGNENMQGIYLHIMADALGSLSVVISTILVRMTGWSGFDPLASCLIAILIFASVVPLVLSTTKILLLSLNSDIEYNLRDILSGVSGIRGVVGYAVPRFWLEDTKKDTSHGHHHGHSHGHDHGHKHTASEIHDHESDSPTVLGVIHVIAGQKTDLDDVRSRVTTYFRTRKMDVVVQIEREGEGRCFCGGGLKSG